MDGRILRLIATVIECCGPPSEGGRGHPPAETVRVLATLRRFLREGTPWRSLTARGDQVSGSTLRRWLTRWAQTGVLAQVHALLVGMESMQTRGGWFLSSRLQAHGKRVGWCRSWCGV